MSFSVVKDRSEKWLASSFFVRQFPPVLPLYGRIIEAKRASGCEKESALKCEKVENALKCKKWGKPEIRLINNQFFDECIQVKTNLFLAIFPKENMFLQEFY